MLDPLNTRHRDYLVSAIFDGNKSHHRLLQAAIDCGNEEWRQIWEDIILTINDQAEENHD
jgi:hypothetical protein